MFLTSFLAIFLQFNIASSFLLKDYTLPTDQTLKCELGELSGFVVTESSETNKAKFYPDINGISVPIPVEFLTDGEKIYLKSFSFKTEPCELSVFSTASPYYRYDNMVYTIPRFQVKRVVTDVKYGSANGYWTSYLTPYNQSFTDTYTNKMADLLDLTNQELSLDLYIPDTEKYQSAPLVLFIHGGAFYSGDKSEEEYTKWCEKFAKCGYVAATINYRMGFSPSQYAIVRSAYRAIQDTRAAIRFLLKNKDELKIDPNRIYLAGCSAGAITALHTAFMKDFERPNSTKGKLKIKLLGENLYLNNFDKDLGSVDSVWDYSNNYSEPFSINAVCNMWGAIFDPEMLSNSPTTRILSIHSRYDPVVPYAQGRPFGESLGLIADLILPNVYGSIEIDNKAKSLGIVSELHTENTPVHTLVKTNGSLNILHDDYFDWMTSFFQKDMIDRTTVSINQDQNEFSLSLPSDQVDNCIWDVEGGVIKEMDEDHKTSKILFFGDADKYVVTAKGNLRSGVPFKTSKEVSKKSIPNILSKFFNQ